MVQYRTMIFAAVLICCISSLFAQRSAGPIKVYGYFQTNVEYNIRENDENQTSFNLQQLNVFFQKNLAPNWSAFINLEVLNSFSSARNWGALNLEEAWVKYRSSNKFNLKLGLQIPIFNNLNEIKNRTPLLPYIIRPIVYETSFTDLLGLEEYLPNRAFIQAYGFLPAGKVKFDYAAYIGNSPNINDDRQRGQTGVDTTGTFLFGGRAGIRYKDIKVGFSFSYDRIRALRLPFVFDNQLFRDIPESPRLRYGFDFSYVGKKFFIETESIVVRYDIDFSNRPQDAQLEFERTFGYTTIGYRFTESLMVYFNGMTIWEKTAPLFENSVSAPNIGAAYNLNDRLVLKTQFFYGSTNIEPLDGGEKIEDKFGVAAAAISVFF